MIKLAAFDVDGTLRERDMMPDSTRVALLKLKDRGIELALCTGRSEFEMAQLREELGIDWAVTCNGSHIGYRGKTIFGNAFSKETIRQWLHEIEQLKNEMILYGSEGMFINRIGGPYFRQAQQEIGFMEPKLIRPTDDMPDVYQCIVFCDEQDEQMLTGKSHDRYYIHRWRPWAVDINPKGTNKAAGILRLADHLGIGMDEVAAFGDGSNDLEMLESVGMGIAMGNATDAVKERARYVTKSLHEGGIAYAVDRWVLGGKLVGSKEENK